MQYYIHYSGTSSKLEDIDNFNSLVDDVIKFTEGDTTILLRSTIAPNTMSNIFKKHSNDLNLRFIYAPRELLKVKHLKNLKKCHRLLEVTTIKIMYIYHHFFISWGLTL